MLRGSFTATIDDKGRLKIPASFRSVIEQEHGSRLYVTSVTGESVRIYPLPVWEGLEAKLSRMPSTHPVRKRFFDRVSYFGQPAEFDAQGRVLIPPRLRESAGMNGAVDVLGQYDFLEVWNHERFLAKLQREPFTEEDARVLAEFGI